MNQFNDTGECLIKVGVVRMGKRDVSDVTLTALLYTAVVRM